MGPGHRVRITVRGRVSTHLATAFEGMSLVRRHNQTDLVGEVVDQAHLFGLLARIRDLGLELDGVRFAPEEASGPPGPKRRKRRET